MAEGKMKLNPAIFGVRQVDPGYIYIVENEGLYKIGKTKKKDARFRAAKTWLPNMKIVGIKPFWGYSSIERELHAGFSTCWYHGEWFRFPDDNDRDLLLEGFLEFSDIDRDRNTVDFIYWFNGDGMAEFVVELYSTRSTLPKFLKQESLVKKSK